MIAETSTPRAAARVSSGWIARVPQAAEKLASAVAIGLIAVASAITTLEQQAADRDQLASAGKPVDRNPIESVSGETLVAGYVGVPYTYPSDLRLEDPAKKSDFTLKRVSWDGKPFKHPLYYGVRVARWAPGNRTGVMVDFLHSKAISRPGETLAIEGTIDGKPAPKSARVEELFRTLEFSHGHNMVMLTGLFRLGALAPSVSPYIGAGFGVALPHTEVKRHSEADRTYEYQYAGPVAQGLLGLELRLPGSSVFVEYKFTFADYRVPMTWRDGHLLVTDVWRQMQEWWAGTMPPAGHASTRLVSHNFIVGAGARIGR